MLRLGAGSDDEFLFFFLNIYLAVATIYFKLLNIPLMHILFSFSFFLRRKGNAWLVLKADCILFYLWHLRDGQM